MSVTVYKDSNANAIFIEDANGVQFINSLQATVPSTTVTITDLAKNIEIVSNQDHADFVDENGTTYEQISINSGGSGTATEVCNLLNSIFQSSGTPLSNVPSITSSLTISLVEGQTLNYELTADYGVGYEWDLSNVSGVTTVEGNVRKLVGGSSLASGTYNIPVKAINYNGEDSETVVLTVSAPPFSNTKSVQFQQNDWLGGNAALIQSLERSSNGSGSPDAWSISFYFKAGSSNNQEQTILYYGSNDINNGNHIRIYYNGNNSVRQKIIFRYGTNNNNLVLATPVSSVSSSEGWQHFLITYDGGTTGASSGSISNYYSRFSIYIDGVAQTTTNSNSNFGITTGLTGGNFRVGRYNTGSYMRNSCKVDELAIWDSDQSSNVSSIYNSGTPFDLSTLGTPPEHWWRMGDGDTYPNLQDGGDTGGCTFVMNSMTSADIVSDVP
tara:strand:+ start:221 stop:1543 length:1323 start_codon:yes stop_codon:yes gene_type:complete